MSIKRILYLKMRSKKKLFILLLSSCPSYRVSFGILYVYRCLFFRDWKTPSPCCVNQSIYRRRVPLIDFYPVCSPQVYTIWVNYLVCWISGDFIGFIFASWHFYFFARHWRTIYVFILTFLYNLLYKKLNCIQAIINISWTRCLGPSSPGKFA